MLSEKIRIEWPTKINIVTEKGHFGYIFCPSAFTKSHLLYKKGMKTHDFLKIEFICELPQNESD